MSTAFFIYLIIYPKEASSMFEVNIFTYRLQLAYNNSIDYIIILLL